MAIGDLIDDFHDVVEPSSHKIIKDCAFSVAMDSESYLRSAAVGVLGGPYRGYGQTFVKGGKDSSLDSILQRLLNASAHHKRW